MNISKKIWLCVAYLTKFAIFVVIRGLCNDYIFSFSKFWPFLQCLCVCIIKTYKNLAISLPSNLTAWKGHYLSMRIIKYMYNYELVSTIYKFISYIIIHFYNHCENCQQLELLFFFFFTHYQFNRQEKYGNTLDTWLSVFLMHISKQSKLSWQRHQCNTKKI